MQKPKTSIPINYSERFSMHERDDEEMMAKQNKQKKNGAKSALPILSRTICR